MCARSMGGGRFPSPPDRHELDGPADLDGRPAGGGSMGELATRPVISREPRPSRVRLDGPGTVAVGHWPVKSARASAAQPGTPDVPAPPVSGGVVSRCAVFGRLA